MSIFQSIEFHDLIRYALAIVILLSSLLAIIYIVWGGFLMIISGGVEEKVKSAVNHMRHAIIGIIFIIVILYGLPVIVSIIGLPYGEYTKPDIIFSTIQEISNMLFAGAGSPQMMPNSSSEDVPSFLEI